MVARIPGRTWERSGDKKRGRPDIGGLEHVGQVRLWDEEGDAGGKGEGGEEWEGGGEEGEGEGRGGGGRGGGGGSSLSPGHSSVGMKRST